ncbi:MAG: hypothetical protein IPN29_01470 [Saprospiraceae bacterium]|nr:hypothetical protein [Saprospiraceae bacterium]
MRLKEIFPLPGRVEKFNPDFILVIGWYYLIPGSMLAMAPKGAAGIHGSLLLSTEAMRLLYGQ